MERGKGIYTIETEAEIESKGPCGPSDGWLGGVRTGGGF
jgi:hypothetical protein